VGIGRHFVLSLFEIMIKVSEHSNDGATDEGDMMDVLTSKAHSEMPTQFHILRMGYPGVHTKYHIVHSGFGFSPSSLG